MVHLSPCAREEGTRSRQPKSSCSDLISVDPQQTLESLAHGLLQVVARTAVLQIAAGKKLFLLALQRPPGATAHTSRFAHRPGVCGIDLAVEIGKLGTGADRLLHRPTRGCAIKAR